MGELDGMIKVVNECHCFKEGCDTWKWMLNKDGKFSSKDLRTMVDDKKLVENRNCKETLWYKGVPRKVNIFLWRLRNNRLPVRMVLDKMGIDLDSILCPFCDNDVETVEHCFLNCLHVKDVWNKIFHWWGLGDVDVDSIEALVKHEGSNQFNSSKRYAWICTIWTALYVIWINRNDKIFRKSGASGMDLLLKTKLWSFWWMLERVKSFGWSWEQWKK